MIHIAFPQPARSVLISAWCRNSSTPERRSAQDGSPDTAIGWCGLCWVEVAWCALRHNPWARETYQRISGGKKSRTKIAVVAVGRKLLVRCWAMLRKQTEWRTELSVA